MIIAILFQVLLLLYSYPLHSIALLKGGLNSLQIIKLPKLRHFARITTSTGINLSLANSFDLVDFLSKYSNKQISGVYALSDIISDSVLYVGISSNVEASISSLMRQGLNAQEHSIRIQTFAVFDVDALKAYQQELIRQLGEVPKYNNPNNNEWMNFLKDSQVDIMFDDSKNKVKVSLDDAKSNKKILKDTISSISSSSSNSIAKVDEVDDEPISVIQSPFLNAGSSTTEESKDNKPLIGLGRGLDFNIKNVDLVLDEIRPFLISDGGNVAVLGVDEVTRSVELSLQGACGSCPSSTTTMKMGIERILRENFVNLGDIVAVNKAADPPVELTKEMILVALNPVLPAVQAMGGKVEVLSVDPGTGGVVLQYKGPAKLKQGVELILKDLPLVKTIEIVT